MKIPARPILVALSCLAAVLLSSCSSTVQSRIEKNPGMYAALSSSEKEAVHTGSLKKGMGKDAVYLSWGRPAGVREGTAASGAFEKWRYVGHYPVVTNNISIGYGYGGYSRHGRHGRCYPNYSYSYGPSVDYIPYTAAVVQFSNGKVTAWERERR